MVEQRIEKGKKLLEKKSKVMVFPSQLARLILVIMIKIVIITQK